MRAAIEKLRTMAFNVGQTYYIAIVFIAWIAILPIYACVQVIVWLLQGLLYPFKRTAYETAEVNSQAD